MNHTAPTAPDAIGCPRQRRMTPPFSVFEPSGDAAGPCSAHDDADLERADLSMTATADGESRSVERGGDPRRRRGSRSFPCWRRRRRWMASPPRTGTSETATSNR